MTFSQWLETEDGKTCRDWASTGGACGLVALEFAYSFGQVDGGRAVDRLLDMYTERAATEEATA